MADSMRTQDGWEVRGPGRLHEADPGMDIHHDHWRASADRGPEGSAGAFIQVDASTQHLARIAVSAPQLLDALEAQVAARVAMLDCDSEDDLHRANGLRLVADRLTESALAAARDDIDKQSMSTDAGGAS